MASQPLFSLSEAAAAVEGAPAVAATAMAAAGSSAAELLANEDSAQKKAAQKRTASQAATQAVVSDGRTASVRRTAAHASIEYAAAAEAFYNEALIMAKSADTAVNVADSNLQLTTKMARDAGEALCEVRSASRSTSLLIRNKYVELLGPAYPNNGKRERTEVEGADAQSTFVNFLLSVVTETRKKREGSQSRGGSVAKPVVKSRVIYARTTSLSFGSERRG